VLDICSMTGYGRGEASSDDFIVVVEIKSVNHRFKDTRCKMPIIFNSIEHDLKKKIGQAFKRGSFDIFINFKRSDRNEKFDDLDAEKIEKFLKKMKEVSLKTNISMAVEPCQFLRQEFLKEQNLEKNENLFKLVQASFESAVIALKKFREIEGEKLKGFILEHKATYETLYKSILQYSHNFQVGIEERLRRRFMEFSKELKVDEPRFLQEVVYYLEKMDVHEETNRIKSHLEKISTLFARGGEVGREMDFLIQELNRETNTIGAKSNIQAISDAIVQMKLQLEKIREQCLNLE